MTTFQGADIALLSATVAARDIDDWARAAIIVLCKTILLPCETVRTRR